MRIAVVLTALHHRCDLQASPIDAEWLLRAKSQHDFMLFVDQATRASETVRLAGIPVSVALKRSLIGIDGVRESSDALQARNALRAHQDVPFDAFVYGNDVNTDYAYFEAVLRSVPRGVCLGIGPSHDLRAVWQDRHLFGRLGRRSWSLSGLAASADFLVSDVSPTAFGLRNGPLLPPRLDLRDEPPAAKDPSPNHRWIVVAATSLGGRDLESLMSRVVEAWPAEDGRTYVVVTRPQSSVGRAADVLLLADCAESLRRQTVVVPAGDDGVAEEFLQAADVIVAASAAELAIPGIADAVRETDWVLLDDAAASGSGSPDAPVGRFPELLPADRPETEIQVISWQDPPRQLTQNVEHLAEDMGRDDYLLLHIGGRAGPSTGLFAMEGLSRVDVVVWGQSDDLLGSPDPERLFPFAFAIRGEVVPIFARALKDAGSIWEVICWLTLPEWIDRLRLLVLPAPAGTECWEVADVDHIRAVCSLHCGVLPTPRWLPAATATPIPVLSPAPAALPRRRFSTHVRSAPRIGLAIWLRSTSWWNRLRVILPWRWGLLERAMKNQL